MVMREDAYWVEARDGRVKRPRCHSVIDSEDFNSYELIDIVGSCCGGMKMFLKKS
ncbi:MAG: hypothetical protein LZ172_07645 [Thaumarchaeota archaeon]|jgi:hypothetical protein|nr:hypothetical protein [Candidatus Geocrenenecus arthurdayi]MCL7390145.1 hypothetical protein [Candidatus Geocrenenecus arthurdayi]MCL7391778.1 hypothetical protein [Candidatus Geocrenenecus arthurdayi]MCL7397188.1 hypothetical protein [Candidatus Geocrenenecus arthurdayi]MCL7404199.1 hypothetical protein [Candidatus Geocrenenecus arthurdayi]